MKSCCDRPDFKSLAKPVRTFQEPDKVILGQIPTIAITPVSDGRSGAYEANAVKTWAMAEKVYDLIKENVRTVDGKPINVVVAPEIVYGARTAARAQAYYATQGVGANIWVGRSWSYSDELMGAMMGIGSSEWQQCAYGLNQTDRPGAVWLKAFTAAMDEKKRPIFCVYSPDLEDEDAPLSDFVATKLLRFARCAAAVAYIRGKNYLSIGGVSMGIIGSDVRRNMFKDYLGMGTVSVDMSIVTGRILTNFYDPEEVAKGLEFLRSFKIKHTNKAKDRRFGRSDAELEEMCIKMSCIVKDLMHGNPKLADAKYGKKCGFKADVEYSQGVNAIAAGTQGQRQWTDYNPNFDVTESMLNSSFDWNGFRAPYIVATENDSKNGLGMLIGNILTGGVPQMFADIRTNWTPASIQKATGVNVSKLCPNGIIDKRNSGAAALDYALNIFKLVKGSEKMTIQEVWNAIRADAKLQEKLIAEAKKNTTYMNAALTYFPGDGLSSHFTSPGGIPMTAYRYNMVGDLLTCSVVEGETVELPQKVQEHINRVTDPTWPETSWTPRGMSSYEYMNNIGPNHDANSFGLIGADFITFNAMLRIPVDMHNVDEKDIFRPTMWQRFGNDDYRVCAELGPIYQ
ncbi:MAG: L-fucose isomerase [Lentisphaerae bacterium]|jgi:L-fucose isomerase|nr:L-fucose isomerase [Lentisphaerota bacterium]